MKALFTGVLFLFFVSRISFSFAADPSILADSLYPDVPNDSWYAPYVQDLTEQEIFVGFPDGRFGSWESINRAEVAKVISILKAKLERNWWQDNLVEIILVLATVIAWVSVVASLRKMTHEIIEAQRHMSQWMQHDLSRLPAMEKSLPAQGTNPSSSQRKPPESEAPPPPAPPAEEVSQVRNEKTNWWM